jgi:ABC-type phosphonate transport system ATPase subunit
VAVLAVSNLRKSYGSEQVVADVSFGIAPGILLAYAAAGFYAASVLFRRRLLK